MKVWKKFKNMSMIAVGSIAILFLVASFVSGIPFTTTATTRICSENGECGIRDPIEKGFVIQSYDRYSNNIGENYIASRNDSVAATIGASSTLFFRPDSATKYVTLDFGNTKVEGDFSIWLWGGASITSNASGTAISATTTNRNYTTAATMLVYYAPTYTTTTASTIYETSVSSTLKAIVSGQSPLSVKLKPDTNYILMYYNQAAVAGEVSHDLRWTEHTDD